MARCCGGSVCACQVQGGNHIEVLGSGTSQDPFVIIGDVSLAVADTSVFNLTLTGTGTVPSPWLISAAFAATAGLDDLPNVNAPSPTNGQVLGYDTSTSMWTNRAATTAAPGAVLTDTSMTGDGSSGSHLQVNEDPAGFLTTGAAGLGLSVNGINNQVRHYGSALARSAATPAPALNTVTMLDDHPGVQFYWTGTQWLPVTNGIAPSFDVEMLALSGSFVAGTPVTLITRQVSETTLADGSFDILSTTDLATASGVLSVSFQETGAFAFKAMAWTDIDRIAGTAYRVDDGTPYALQPITGTVTAYIY